MLLWYIEWWLDWNNDNYWLYYWWKFINFNDYLLFEIYNENNFFIVEIKLLLVNESVEDFLVMENMKFVVINNMEGSVELWIFNLEIVGGEM